MIDGLHYCVYILPTLFMLLYWVKARRSLRTLKSMVIPKHQNELKFSKPVLIIIPFCNEIHHLPNLLHDLTQLETLDLNVQIVLVDDHSSDGSEIFASEHLPGLSYISILKSTAEPGKKHAIQCALDAYPGAVFCTTDADVRLPKNWLIHLLSVYVDSEPAMVIGQVRMNLEEKFLCRFQYTEWLLLQGLTLSSALQHKAVLCNGSNLLIERESFEKIGGYTWHLKHASGDDMYSLIALKTLGEGAVKIQCDPHAMVQIQPQRQWGAFLKQRLRWASKTKLLRDKNVFFSGALIMAANLSLLWCALCSPYLHYTSHLYFALLGIKCISDYGVAEFVAKQRNQTFHEIDLITLNLIYPLYAVFIGLVSRIYVPNWKHSTAK